MMLWSSQECTMHSHHWWLMPKILNWCSCLVFKFKFKFKWCRIHDLPGDQASQATMIMLKELIQPVFDDQTSQCHRDSAVDGRWNSIMSTGNHRIMEWFCTSSLHTKNYKHLYLLTCWSFIAILWGNCFLGTNTALCLATCHCCCLWWQHARLFVICHRQSVLPTPLLLPGACLSNWHPCQ